MNLYLLEVSENFNHDKWDYYECCVVAAENESKAKLIHPFLDSLNDKKSDFAINAGGDFSSEGVGA